MPERKKRLTKAQLRPIKAPQKWLMPVFGAILVIAAGVVNWAKMNLQHDFVPYAQMKAAASSPQAAAAAEHIIVAQPSASGPVDTAHFSTQPATGIFADGGG